MITSRPLIACLLSIVAVTGCTGTFGSVGRSTRISDSARITASSIVPDDSANRGVVEHLALAEEVYSKTLDALRERRNTLRSRRRALTLGGYATFAATTLVISAAAISKSNSGDTMMSTGGLRTAGYGALGGLGVGTTLEVMNLMQEDPSNVETKIHQLQASYDNMIDRLHVVFEQRPEPRAPEGGAPGAKPTGDSTFELEASPIIEAFINEALQINVKG